MDNKIIKYVEDLVTSRSKQRARREIRAFLRRHSSIAAILMAADWLRRMSLYPEGLKLLLNYLARNKRLTRNEVNRIQIRLAEFFSLVGAKGYALQTVTNLKPNDWHDHAALGGIYLVNYDYSKALSYFERAIKLFKSDNIREQLLLKLSQADCLVRLKHFEKAITLAKEVLQKAEDNLLKGIALQAIGQYYAERESFSTALEYLEEANSYFPKNDNTYDNALLQRWLGYSYACLKQKKLALKAFAKSTELVRRTGMNEDSWLENYLLMYRANVLPKNLQLEIQNYPGLPWEFISVTPPTRSGITISKNKKLPKLTIFLSANEYHVGKNKYLGIPVEIKFLYYVKCAESFGIGTEKLKFMLWPKERESYPYLGQRLFLLAQRLRQVYGIYIFWKNKMVYLKRTNASQIRIVDDPVPTFLQNRDSFTSKDLCGYYEIKKSASFKYIGEWERAGFIKIEKMGPRTKYTSCVQQFS